MKENRSWFVTEELVPKRIFLERGHAAIELIDSRALAVLNRLRNHLNVSMTINNWKWGGPRSQSGLRTWEFYGSKEAYDASLSQHKYGRGFDILLGASMPVKVAVKFIIEHHHLFPEITFIEIDQGWLHIDFRRNRNGEPLVLWSPERDYVEIADFLKEAA